MHPSATYGQPQQDYYDESSGSNGTGVQRKLLQRRATASENDDLFSHPYLPPSVSSKPAPAQTNGAPTTTTTHVRRRSTLMQNKATSLLGPRPLQGTKRITSDSHLTTPSFGPVGTTRTTTGEALFGDLQTHPSTSKFSFSTSDAEAWPHEETETDRVTDFLPSVNFDELHTRLTTTRQEDASSSSFSFDLPHPAQSRYGQDSSLKTNYDGPYSPSTHQAHPTSSLHKQGIVSRSQSLLRKDVRLPTTATTSGQYLPSTNSRATLQPDLATQNPRTSTTAATSAPRTAGRIPRKSIAPTTSIPDHQLPSTNSGGNISRSSSLLRSGQNKPVPRTAGPSDYSYHDHSAKAARTRSMQPPPPKHTLARLDAHAVGGTQSLISSPVGMMPPANAFDLSTLPQTPSSVGSRQSSMHVGGLGARTISPTDARRMKRRSMANPVMPSLPSSQFMLQTEARAARRAAANSPASSIALAAAGKSLTPSSSARNTPDQTRKPSQGQSHAVSGSTTTSNSSLRTPVPATSNVRASQIQAASRLPQPKARNVHSSAGIAPEEVPPVPAIPKAYESPQDTDALRASYFGVKRSIAGELTSTLEDLTPPQPTEQDMTFFDEPVGMSTSQNPAVSTRQRRGMTESTGNAPSPYSYTHNGQRRTLQPLMLPPLNLTPLDSSTSSRFSAIPTPNNESVLPVQTPPPRRQNAKTPSTPMTASKATFFARSTNFDDEPFIPADFRANTSQHIFRPAASASTILSPRTSTILPPDQLSSHGPSLTPLLSSSVPSEAYEKSAEHTPNSLQLQTHDVLLDSTSAWAEAPAVQSPQLSRKDTSTSITDQSITVTEPSTPGTATSLRRKLSLSWKRSSSKASQRIKAELFPSGKEAEARRQSKSKEMPPPKMPASANWKATTFSNSASEYSNARPSLDTKFRQSNSSVLSMARNPETASRNPSRIEGAESKSVSTHARTSSRSSSSLLNPVRNMLSSSRNSTINTLKARHLDINLDKDDLAADKIMEKLSAKRKDFEQAAKDVDELRKRATAREKFSSLQAIQNHALNIFERGEVIDYKEVYFCGTRNARKHIGDLDSPTNNFGYDDERGDYNIVLGDHLSYRYEVVDVLGKGSFGQVVRCVDHKTGLLVAIKIIRNKKRFHQQALVEVDILQRLREWDPNNDHSMINFTQSFYFRGHLCISTELLSMNLYEFIKAHEFKGFPIALIRRFTKQMLSSLVLLKSKRVIHCDLKPENVLLVHPIHSEIKVIDFGSSCFENEKVYTYIQSRFYRSPEVILGMSYGLPIDMWSLGCILAELFTGYPIFPGENEQEQLACIMEIFGPPEKHIVEKSSRRKLFFDSMGKPRVTVSSKGRRRRPSSRTLQQALKCDDEAFLDFVARCLRWDPERRLKPEEALHHEYVTGIRRPTINNRARTHPAPVVTAAAPSPVKRTVPGSTPLKTNRDISGPRTLPESASFDGLSKATTNGVSTQNKDNVKITAANLAVKAAAANRRHSTVMPVQPANPVGGVKRASGITATAGITSTSNLPRVAGLGSVSSYVSQQRSTSGKPDMAAAAAMASINVHRPR